MENPKIKQIESREELIKALIVIRRMVLSGTARDRIAKDLTIIQKNLEDEIDVILNE